MDMNRINVVCLSTVMMIFVFLSPFSTSAQSENSGPWWPNSEWGAEDQAGASNRITPQKVKDALEWVSSGKIYELGHLYEQSMPLFGTRTYSMTLPAKGTPAGSNGLIGNEEFLSTQIGQVGTQFDGLGHIGMELELEDGDTKMVFYNGFTAEEMDTPSGLQKLGIEHVKPILTRGFLIDIASLKDVSRLDHSYEVTLQDVLSALEKQNISESEIEPGDALLFRYGWSSLWDEPDTYNTNPPGIGLEVARWVAKKKITMVGSDSWPTEVVPNPDENLVFPVHQELLVKNGIFNLENLVLDELAEDQIYKFLLIVTPIQFKGATGSPVRPIAVY